MHLSIVYIGRKQSINKFSARIVSAFGFRVPCAIDQVNYSSSGAIRAMGITPLGDSK